MTYSVIWRLSAIQSLNQISAAATDPKSVELETNLLDYILRRWPDNHGESRGSDRRIWYGDHIGLIYTVDDINMRVEVLAVAPSRRR